MACYFNASVAEFLRTTPSEVLTQLTLRHAADGFAEMRTELPLTWWNDLDSLRVAMDLVVRERPDAASWQLLLEFAIPRKMKRLDVVLVTSAAIVILECKTGSINSEARRQVEEYALLLHYFHKPSDQRRLLPIVVSRSVEQITVTVRQHELEFPSLPSYWISPTQSSNWQDLPAMLSESVPESTGEINGDEWNEGSYRPTPTIIEAALSLRSGLRVGDIAQSEAAEQDIAEVTRSIQKIVQTAQSERQHVIVFLTGVPGSGKTLVGLSLAHLSESRTDAIHFMSGNGPLVSVLQEVFRRHAMQEGVPSGQAQIRAETLIENVHHFAKEYTEKDKDRAPSNHVVVFDEAQRAWDLAQSRRKFAREDSEPDMLLKIMERHEDWACVVALVGGGQEINDGEAGLEEWGKTLSQRPVPWRVYASPEVINGGTSTAYRRLFGNGVEPRNVQTSEMLHLRTSSRSLRADNLAAWVNAVLAGEAESAAKFNIADKFPLFLTRNLNQARSKLRHESLGESRFGLVGSSEADRLRAEGLEPSGSFHRDYPWHHWYLAGRDDVRSSYFCEVFATEFEIQGLELDWIGLCWGGDLIREDNEWRTRKFWTPGIPKWIHIRNDAERQYRINAYRVLLTRARQGTVIYVPAGDVNDPTRSPTELDCTAEYLLRCGVRQLRS
jgi:Uncharacterized conserved protein (DUF2075)